MHVDSYLEIFTTMYGWAFANIISSIIIGTGLVVVPFFVIIFKKWMDAKEQGMQAGGILSLLEAAQTRLVVALFVATLCFFSSPSMSLKSTDLIYQPAPTLANANPAEVSRDKGTGTTYSNAMEDSKNLDNIGAEKGLDKVPLWWFSVMAISSGINNAIRDGIKSAQGSASMRELQMIAQNMGVTDPGLAGELARFRAACYNEARRKYDREIAPDDYDAEWKKFLENEYNRKDPEGIDSRLFRGDKRFYASIQSTIPSTLFKYEAQRDEAMAGGAPADPSKAQGYPMCDEWWEAIQKYIIEHNEANKEFNKQAAQEWLVNNSGTNLSAAGLGSDSPEKKVKDITTKVALFNFQQYYGAEMKSDGMSRIVGALGIIEKRFESAVLYAIMVTGLPMIQALLLMGIYTFLPLAVFLSGFDLRAMFLGAVAILTVKLFASMWVIAMWIDSKLLDAMYPNGSSFFTKTAGDVANGYKELVLGIMLMMLFVGLPMLWLSMMGWLGIQAARGLNHMLDTGRASVTQAAHSGTSTVSTAGRMAVTKGMGGGSKSVGRNPSQTTYISYGSK